MTRSAICAANGCHVEVERGKLMCKRHWFSLPKALRDEVWRTWRAYFKAAWHEGVGYERHKATAAAYREAVRAAIAYLEVVPAPPPGGPAEDPRPTPQQIRDRIDIALAERRTAEDILGELKRLGGRYRYAHGTYELRLLAISATCTAGGAGLLRAWQRAVDRKFPEEART